MKSLILLQILLLSFVNSWAQQWKPYRIDDSVQVGLPSEFQKKDTLGQQIFTAGTQFGNILIIKTPDDPSRTPDIEKKSHLENFYQEYVKKVSGSVKGSVVSEEKDTTINNLRYKDFTLQADSGGGKQFRNFRIVHVNSATYIFQFLYQDVHKDYATAEIKSFFNSIKIPPDATVVSQFTDPANTTGTPPSGNKYSIIAYGVAALIFILIIIFFVKRRKRSH